MIHSTAIIDPTAIIAPNVHIGAYSIIGPEVEIGEGTWIGPHVVIKGFTKIGKDNKIFQFSSLGEEPQDKKYRGERSFLVIGDVMSSVSFVRLIAGLLTKVSLALAMIIYLWLMFILPMTV